MATIGMKKEIDQSAIDLALHTQRALLGMIYAEIRAIAVGLPKRDKLKVIVYLDREPSEFDYENLSDITGEILADIPEISNIEEVCVFTKEPINTLDILDFLVYRRKE